MNKKRNKETEDERESRRIRETTPEKPTGPQTPTSDGDGESGTGDYGEELGGGGHRGLGKE
jgi:hypothetical protein